IMQSGDMLDIDEIVQILSIDLIGIVTDDDEVIKASNKGEPVAFHPKSKPSIAYRNIARRILGESVPLQVLDQEVSVMQRLKKFFGMKLYNGFMGIVQLYNPFDIGINVLIHS